MKKLYLLITTILLFSSSIFSQVNYSEYFLDKALRLDYYHVGDINSQLIAFDELIEEPYYAGSKVHLIDPFKYGIYLVEVCEFATGKLIYSKGYSTLFSEWLTTAEAKTVKRSFSETFLMPYPKNKVMVKFYTRNKNNIFEFKDSLAVDPNSPFVKKDRRFVYPAIKLIDNGDYNKAVDVVIIPEGYTEGEKEKLDKDVDEFIKNLFNSSPYKENKKHFNIWLVNAPSAESGVDIPRETIYKNTLVSSTFYTFDLERYLMTSDNKKLRDVASNAPYDQIYILANTTKYGGGSIYNHYSVTVSDNRAEEYITVHEFGHGFGGLGDEYYTSSVAYEEFYKLDVEPWEPNLTTLVNFDSKWKNMLDKNTPIPTPATAENKDLLGVYEGGGYVAKGVYRSRQDCTMKSLSVDNFCPVCKKAIEDMIKIYIE